MQCMGLSFVSQALRGHEVLVLRILADEALHGRAGGDNGASCRAGVIERELDERLGQALALEFVMDDCVVELANLSGVLVVGEAASSPSTVMT